MKCLFLCIGIPGSGKSTWAKEFVTRFPKTKIVSSDEIREEIFKTIEYNAEQAPEVYDVVYKRAEQFLNEGSDVIIDATNVSLRDWLRYRHLIKGKDDKYCGVVFNISPNDAIKRMEQREYKVPFSVLLRKWEIFQRDKNFLSYIFDFIF